MTDRIIAVLVYPKAGDLTDRQIDSLALIRHVDSVSRVSQNGALLILEHEIRTDDFEVIEEALSEFGFKIKQRVINDFSLVRECSSLAMHERLELITNYRVRKPALTKEFPHSSDVRDFTISMKTWSSVMKKLLEIDFKE